MKVYGIQVFDDGKLLHTEVYKDEGERNKNLRRVYTDKELSSHYIDLFETEIK